MKKKKGFVRTEDAFAVRRIRSQKGVRAEPKTRKKKRKTKRRKGKSRRGCFNPFRRSGARGPTTRRVAGKATKKQAQVLFSMLTPSQNFWWSSGGTNLVEPWNLGGILVERGTLLKPYLRAAATPEPIWADPKAFS